MGMPGCARTCGRVYRIGQDRISHSQAAYLSCVSFSNLTYQLHEDFPPLEKGYSKDIRVNHVMGVKLD